MVNDILANSARAAHDIGLAAWLGGSMFGKFALNPSVAKVRDPAERGAVVNAAWNGYNVINAVGLGAAAAGWAAARFTETKPDHLTDVESGLSLAKDVLMGVSVLSGVLSGVQGGRLMKQAPDGRVPVETGTTSVPETPAAAVRIQQSLELLGNVSIVAGVSLVGVNAVLAQVNYSRPPAGRALTRGSSPDADRSPVWIAAGVTTGAALIDQVRRQLG